VSTTSITASQMMDKAASLMNDTAKEVYTYEAQLPYFQMAVDELQEIFELNNIPVTQASTVEIDIDVGTTQVNPVEDPAPNYPANLIEIQQIWERLQGSTQPYLPMTKRDFLPHYLQDQNVDALVFWVWNEQRIKFMGATTDREIRLDYIFAIFPDTDELDQNSVLGVMNCRSFLQYRTAGLCSEFIGENSERATSLNNMAIMAIDRSLGISVKGKQQVMRRRRPFRATYKTMGSNLA
jgi:hypothetical protein